MQERLYSYRNLWSGKSDQNILGWLNFSATKIFPDKVYYFRVERLLNSFGFYTLSLLFCRLNGTRIVNCFVWRFQWTFIRHKRRTAFKMVSWKDRHTSTRHGIGLNMRWELQIRLFFLCLNTCSLVLEGLVLIRVRHPKKKPWCEIPVQSSLKLRCHHSFSLAHVKF